MYYIIKLYSIIMYTVGELFKSVVWIFVRKAFDNIANTSGK